MKRFTSRFGAKACDSLARQNSVTAYVLRARCSLPFAEQRRYFQQQHSTPLIIHSSPTASFCKCPSADHIAILQFVERLHMEDKTNEVEVRENICKYEADFPESATASLKFLDELQSALHGKVRFEYGRYKALFHNSIVVVIAVNGHTLAVNRSYFNVRDADIQGDWFIADAKDVDLPTAANALAKMYTEGLVDRYNSSQLSTHNSTMATIMDVDEYAAQFQHAFKFELRSILPADKIAGLDTLASVIRGWVQYTDESCAIQYSSSYVIKNASGVGKTFGSVAVASVLNDGQNVDFYLPLYVGFNSDFPLSATELFYLRGGERLVERIIARRALHQLWALVALCKAEGNSDKKLWDIVVQGEGGSRHLVPLPTQEDNHLFKRHNAFPLNERPVIASLINELSKRCGGRRLVVLFILDEGQIFDEAVRAPKEGGARLALNYARRLQLECSESTKALLLPIMTGINPKTSLQHSGDGTSEVYSGPLHTRKEFLAVATALMENGIKVSNVGLLATLMYPVARDVKLFFARVETTQPFTPAPHAVDPDLAPLFLMASGTETKIDNRYSESAIPANFDAYGIHFTPIPSFLRIDECLGHCDHIHRATGGLFSACDSNVRSNLDEQAGGSAALVEAEVARMLQIILATTNTPLGSCGTGKDYKRDYEVMRTKWLAKNPWMDFNGATRFPAITTPTDYKSFIYPTAAKHGQDAFALLGKLAAMDEAKKDEVLAARVAAIGQSDPQWQSINLHPLHEDICSALKALKSKGQCYSIQCQGSAPMHYIYIVLTSDRGPDGRCTVELRLADARHSARSDSTRILSKKDITDLLPTFSSATDYLQIALSNECGMTVVGQRHAIITNCRVAEDAKELYGPQANDATAAVTCVLSPETLTFPPFTNYLFSVVTEE